MNAVNRLVVFVTLAVSVLGSACDRQAPPAPNVSQAATETQLAIKGMSCGSCAQTITKTLTDVPGVQTAKVDFSKKQATVHHDSQRVRVAVLIAAIKKLGYQATEVMPASTGNIP